MNQINETIVKVPFGSTGYQKCKNNARINGELDPKKLVSEMFGYLFDGILVELKNMGYRKIGRSRLMFEEAIDWQIKFEINRIIKQRKESGFTKIAKFAYFRIGHDIPKVE